MFCKECCHSTFGETCVTCGKDQNGVQVRCHIDEIKTLAHTNCIPRSELPELPDDAPMLVLRDAWGKTITDETPINEETCPHTWNLEVEGGMWVLGIEAFQLVPEAQVRQANLLRDLVRVWNKVSLLNTCYRHRLPRRRDCEMEWRDIATAPKGRELLLYYPQTEKRHPNDVPLSPMYRIAFMGSTPHRQPSHWMPLPEPPTPTTSEE